MNPIELIPQKNEINVSLSLADAYGAAFEYNDFFVPDVLDEPEQIRALIEFYEALPRDRSLDTLHGAFLDVTIHSSDSLIRATSEKRIRQSMDIAARLAIRGVVFHTNFIANFFNRPYLDGWLKLNRDFFSMLAGEYPQLQIYMENMFDLTPEQFVAFGEAMRDYDNVHLCLDVAHAHLSEVAFPGWIRNAAPYIRHIHINDNDGHSDLHDAVGTGTIDWQLFSSLMKSEHVNASVLIETSSIEKQRNSLEFMAKNHIFPFD